MKARTLAQEQANGGLPGGVDHVKWLAYMNHRASKPGFPGFDAVPGQELSCETWLSGVDYQAEGIEVVYHLFSTRLLQKCVLKTRVDGEGQSLPSVSGVWAGANWHEREAAEMLNLVFDGHPYLEPLLLEKDEEGRVVPGPILLKRFQLRPKEPPGVYGFPEEE